MPWLRRGEEVAPSRESGHEGDGDAPARLAEAHSVRRLPSLRTGRTMSIAMVSGKGGVGKTTTVINVGAVMAERGLNTLVVDCDPQSNLTSGVGLEPYQVSPTIADVLTGAVQPLAAIQATATQGLWVLPASPDLTAVEARLTTSLGKETVLHSAMSMFEVTSRFDVILYDTPPNFGLHTLNALAATKHVLVPLQISGFAVRGLKEVLRVIAASRAGLNTDLRLLGVVATFVDIRVRIARDLIEGLNELEGIKVFSTHIPFSVRLQETGLTGKPITETRRARWVSEAYRSLVSEILGTLGSPAAYGPAMARAAAWNNGHAAEAQ